MKRWIATLALLGAVTTAATAQEFPSRHVTLVMPFAAGGPGDTMARLIALGMSNALKQQVIVENTAGAGGTVGSGRVAAATGDGYTLLMNHIGAATNAALYPNLKYDKTKDFEPIGLVVEVPMAFVGKKTLEAKSLGDLIAYAKAAGDKATYAHAGIGSASHLCGLLFGAATGTKFSQVAYRGTGPAMNDLVGGQVDFSCDQTANVVSNIQGGAIKGYAVTIPGKVDVLPDLPTADASGLKGFNLSIWYGMWAPKGTPKPVVDKLTAALAASLKDPAVADKLKALGAQTYAADKVTPAGLDAHVKAEIAKWSPIIKAAGVVGQ